MVFDFGPKFAIKIVESVPLRLRSGGYTLGSFYFFYFLFFIKFSWKFKLGNEIKVLIMIVGFVFNWVEVSFCIWVQNLIFILFS